METATQTNSIISAGDDREIKRAAKVTRALNHPLRKSILETIEAQENKMRVTDIYVRLRLEQSVASQHLSILRDANLVTTVREGKQIFYSVNHDRIQKVVSHCCLI